MSKLPSNSSFGRWLVACIQHPSPPLITLSLKKIDFFILLLLLLIAQLFGLESSVPGNSPAFLQGKRKAAFRLVKLLPRDALAGLRPHFDDAAVETGPAVGAVPLVQVRVDVLGGKTALAGGFPAQTSAFLDLGPQRRLDQRGNIGVIDFEEGVASELRNVMQEV